MSRAIPNAFGTPEPADFTGSYERFSPLRFLIITIGGIFLAEVIAMIFLRVFNFKILPYYLQTLIDAGIMIVLISPILYFFSLRPLLLHIERRKQIETRLHEMALFPALNPDAVLQVNALGEIKKTNPSARKMGLFVGSQLSILIPDLRDLDLSDCIATGSTRQIQQTQLGDHILQWVIHGAPELGLAFLYSTDVTEQKRAEIEIYRLSSIVERTADTVVVTNREGVIEYVNPAFELQTGYSKADVLGQTPRVLKSGVHDERFYQTLWGSILKGDVFHGEITNRKKNGELLHETKTITPLRNAQGNITHFVATGKDITERKLAEEQLRKAYDEVELRVQERTEELKLANNELQVARLAAIDLMEDAVRSQKELEKVNVLLREGEERLNRAQEIAHLGSWELNLVNNRLTWSDEVYRIFGLQPQQFGATYEAFLEAVHPDDRCAVDEAYSSSLQNGRDSYEIEHRVVRHSSGEVRIVHEKCDHIRNEAGQIIRSVGMVHDITARKQADDALRQSEEQFYKVFHFSPVGVNLFRLADGCSVDVNDAFLELTGYSREEFIGYSGLELNLFPDPDERTKWMQGVLEYGAVRNIDSRIRRKSGQIADVLFSIVRTEINGEMMGLVMVIDITERRMAEEALRRAHDELEMRVRERTKELANANRELSDEIAERKEIERQLRIETTALEAAANGVIIADATGSILWANPAFLNMSGYDMDEVIGSTPHILSSGRQDKAYYQDLWRTILEGNTWRGETVNRRKDGSLYVEEQTITPVRLESGQLTHFIAIKQDVTERKRAEDALRESEEKFRTLVEWTYDWEIWLDPQGNIVYNSPSCERITGYKPDEFVEKPDLMSLILHPGDRPVYESHQRLLHDASAGIEKMEYRVIARNGEEHWIEHICRPLFGTDNHYLGRRISNRDVTEQKQVEENIRERNQKEKLLIQTIHTMQLDIARDLHDTIGQNIGYLRMKLDHMVEKDIPAKGGDLRAEFSQMSQVANESYDLVRGTLAILQSQGSDDLLQLFKRYAGQIVERSEFKIEFTDQGKAEFVTIHQMRQLFYIFREALSNIEKHSGASHAWVDMKWSATMVELSIKDNGRGFDLSQNMVGHYGLKFMRERTEMMKGSFQLKTEPGAGTHIIIGVPLHGSGSDNEMYSISNQEEKDDSNPYR